jgi:hypothetical protein
VPRPRRKRPAACLAVAVALIGAGAAAGAERQVRIVRVKLCTQAEVQGTVGKFVAAFNAGDTHRLDGIFARSPYFRWYSTDAPGERLLPLAADRASLLPYLARRHALGERLTLRSLRVNGNTIASGRGWKTYGNFAVVLVREASDLSPTEYQGKGALHCYATRPDELIVWSMGRKA